MKSLCFYFQVHQPFRLRTYRFFDIGENHYYFDEYRNRYIIKRVAGKCYLPMNNLLLELIRAYGSEFKVSFSLSGMVLEQFTLYAPEVLESFQRLAATGNVEFIAETYAHSLASVSTNQAEFINQVKLHRKMVNDLFGMDPQTFRNTELIYSNDIGKDVAEMGFKTMLSEGAKHIMGWKSPNYMYCNAINPKLKLLLKNFQLSDDIAFRFSQQSWEGWPLTTEKFVDWLNANDPEEQTVNLFMDYETFGEHQWPETGIFAFMRELPRRVLSHSDYRFHTPSELNELLQPVAAIDVYKPISWADEERDLTAWLGNDLQKDAFEKIYELEEKVFSAGDEELLREWRLLQTSDHFYYMCTKWFSDGDVHKYFNPYNSPYEAYVNYMNILSDFMIRLGYEKKIVKADTLPEPAAPPKAVRVAKELLGSKKTKKAATAKTGTAKKTKALAAKEADVNAGVSDMITIMSHSDTAIRKALKGIDAFTIGVALYETDKDIRNRIAKNLGIRTFDKLRKMQFSVNDLHPREIERCRKKILKRLGNSPRKSK